MVSAEELLERVWDEAADPFTTAVKTTIRRLRAKLGDPPVIQTVREGGYRIGERDGPAAPAPPPRRTLRIQLALLYGGAVPSPLAPWCSWSRSSGQGLDAGSTPPPADMARAPPRSS